MSSTLFGPVFEYELVILSRDYDNALQILAQAMESVGKTRGEAMGVAIDHGPVLIRLLRFR
jgi:hypothetical protein